MDSNAHTDVLIVGAGPVGMTAGILLAAQGVKVCIVEKNSTTADDPKAISIDDESLRVYSRAGIGTEVLSVIVPGTGTTYYGSDGLELFHGGAAIPFRSGFPFKNPFAQPDLERVLRSALEAHPLVELHFGTELVDFEQDDNKVRATVRRSDVHSRITAAFLLGADGGRSRVRSILEIPMSGRSHDDVWLVIDCLEDAHRERYGMHHADPRRPHVIVPGLNGRCRYEFYLRPGEGEATTDPSFDLIERLLRPYRTITPEQVERAVAYRFHGLNAEKWRCGRAFLMGDAAHMMPPFAGQGLNSGIRDAANLTWKLASVLNGRGSDELLDSYAAERRPHAEAVIRSSERLGRVVMTTNRRLAHFRDDVVRSAMSTVEGREFFEHMKYRPSTRISEGCVIKPGQHELVGMALGQPSVFDFRTHRLIALDALTGGGWSVIGVGLGPDPSHAAWDAAAQAYAFLLPTLIDVPLNDEVFERPDGVHVAIDIDTRLYGEVSAARGGFIIMRPDRVVAAVAATSEIEAVAAQLSPMISAPSAAEAVFSG